MYLWQSIRPIVLDFASTIVFLVVFELLHNVTLAIVLGMATGIAEIGWQLARRRRISAMEGMSLFLVLSLGLASLLTHDPRFVMLKPTIGYVAVGIVMLKPGWQANYAPQIALQLVPRIRFVAWGYVWAGLIFLTAVVNLILIALVDVKTWGVALTVWSISTKLGLFALEYLTVRAEAVRNYRARAALVI